MIITKTKYVIATTSFPLEFENNNAYDTPLLEDAAFYNSEIEANNELDRFDESESRQIIPVTITYEI